ncbi:MAG: S8 family peptidase [Bacteroidia bacterium]|nr:S8 family peptidase [Bacteroidia bacterium]
MRPLTYLLILIFLASGNFISAQSNLGPDLRQALQADPPAKDYRVLIQLYSPLDLEAMTLNFRENHTPATVRWQQVIRALMNQAQFSQNQLDQDLHLNGILLQNCHKFWITNAWVARADRPAIQFLANHPLVEYIELESAWLARPIEQPRPASIETRTVGGHEIGLERVKAHKLWKMGYTGKGRISMSLDTGVWTEHPAIGGRFLGNFLPLSQTWFGLDFVTPLDKEGSHGTHTLGIALGLDEANADTIGMAFGAYWIASDVVATDLAKLHPLSDFLLAFEWAINPDGDTTTTSDVPDAINNSWGFFIPTDTNMCTSTVSATFDALEAAGIANVFSAGNDGPGAGTVSYPQHVSNGLVNTLTVGALDGNNPSLPIAAFSSRGPTICPRTGSLLIKPEVSAPGVNVRSSVGKGGYAVYSGTSMAAPHVTGAVVLLKEAFPTVAGDEILLALYNSAIDLGTPGEDNAYGMGVIDVEAAFNYLSQTYTPLPPSSPNWDLAIVKVLEPAEEFLCDTVIYPQIVIENLGNNPLTNATITFSLNGGAVQAQSWSGNLTSNQRDTLTLPGIAVPNSGSNELFVRAIPGSGATEQDTINNRRYFRFWRQALYNYPFSEGFETVDLNNGDWHIINEDAEITWDTLATGGIAGSTKSAYLNFADYLPKILQRDDLLSAEISIPDTGAITLTFKVAYQHRHNIFSDSLQVWGSTDCGLSWTGPLYYKGGADLSTHDTVTVKFIPSRPSHWRTEYVDLSGFAGSENLILKWVGINNKGNYLFVDDINLYAGAQVGISQQMLASRFEIYPNPTQQNVNLKLPESWKGQMVKVSLLDITGRFLQNWELLPDAGNEARISVNGWPAGMYFVQVCQRGNCLTRKLLKQ